MNKILLALLLSALLLGGCGAKDNAQPSGLSSPSSPAGTGQTGQDPGEPAEGGDTKDHPDLTGVYTDKQNTTDVYSQLTLTLQADGTYAVEMSVYRTASLEGAAAWEGDVLRFTSEDPCVTADITVEDGRAEVKVLTGAAGLLSGSVYPFPDGAPGDASAQDSGWVEAEEPEIIDPGLPGGQDAARPAYQAALRNLLESGVFPNGEEALSFEDSSPGQFAIWDVDGDGQEELIILHTDAPTAGMVGKVYSYDPASGEVREQFSDFCALTFFDNGIIKVDWSHNQGRAGDALWPYTLWQYEPDTDSYTAAGMVDAWDRRLGEEFGEAAFPAEADEDGDGVVYYIMKYGAYELTRPVDGDQYDQWQESILGGAAEINLPFQDLTEKNLANIG